MAGAPQGKVIHNRNDSMKKSTIIIISLACAVGLARVAMPWRNLQESRAENPTPQDIREAESEKAESAMLLQVSNHVGFQRIIQKICQASPLDDITNWRGSCTFDYVNTIGGVERTNIAYIFKALPDGLVSCQQDPAWEMELFHEEMLKHGNPP